MVIRVRVRIMNLTDALLLTCVVLGVMLLWVIGRTPLKEGRIPITASNGKVYVVRNTTGATSTAEALARLDEKLRILVSLLEKSAASRASERLPMVNRIKERFNGTSMSEGVVDKRFTSYTVNKGDEIVMCMRSRDGRDHLYEDNKLFGVAVHELAHVGSIHVGHGPEFKDNFAWILDEAVAAGLYKRILEPFQYCGITVGSL